MVIFSLSPPLVSFVKEEETKKEVGPQLLSSGVILYMNTQVRSQSVDRSKKGSQTQHSTTEHAECSTNANRGCGTGVSCSTRCLVRGWGDIAGTSWSDSRSCIRGSLLAGASSRLRVDVRRVRGIGDGVVTSGGGSVGSVGREGRAGTGVARVDDWEGSGGAGVALSLYQVRCR